MKRKPALILDESKAFGRGVKATLDALDKSQYWLEEQTGVGVSSLNKIIIGKSNPMLATAIKISQALKIDVHTLIRIGELPG
jgi:hypothetical protein